MKFLQQDSPMVRLLNRLLDLVVLNVFWLICSLPIITIGASTTALYDVTLHLALGEDVSLIRRFFHAFVHNLKRGTLLFFLTVLAGGILIADFWCATVWNVSMKFLFQVVILAVGYFYLAVVSHSFPALAYFDQPVRATLRNSFFYAMRNGIFTVFVMLMDVLPFLLVYTLLSSSVLPQMVILILTIGIAGTAYLNSLHLVRLFDPERVKALQKQQEEEEQNHAR